MQTTPTTDQPGTADAPDEQQLKRTLAANLAALDRDRPDIARRLYDALEHDDGRFEIRPDPKGGWTVFQRFDNNRAASLSPLQKNVNTLNDLFRETMRHFRDQPSVALLGAGDGRMLRWFADHPPKKFMDAELCVYFIEPDPHRLLRALMLHDFSNENGPIVAQRFRWYVGEDWADQMRGELDECTRLPQPKIFLGITSLQKSAQQAVERMYGELNGRAAQRLDAVTKWSDARSDAELAALFSDDPPRQPRVLLMTSRLTTVLQYSTADLADAFEQLGWDATVVIEQRPFEKHTFASMVDAIDSVRPDLIVTIDHLRHEAAFFPASMPHICWIQDHLPNLTSSEAGRKIDARQFVLTNMTPMYCGQYEYPRRQCISLGKLTRVPDRPSQWRSDGDEITFVSHASKTPARHADDLAASAGDSAEGRRFIRRACDRMIELYEQGGSLPTYHHLLRFLSEVQRDEAVDIPDPDAHRGLAEALYHQLNNALYRQQALGWAIEAAEVRGLRVGVYGQGWESHPRFASYARGPVQYGRALEELTRQSRINLQIVPFLCLHQRLLDGLVAGGFFLVREHPADRLLPELRDFLNEHVGEDVVTVDEARRRVESSHRAQLEDVLNRCQCLGEHGDVISRMRDNERAGALPEPGRPILPRFDEVAFNNAEELAERLDRFVDDEQARREIADQQCATIESRLSYVTGARRVIAQIHNRFAESVGEQSHASTSTEPAS